MSIFQNNDNNVSKTDLQSLTLYRSVFDYLNSNMYFFFENQEAIVIDPNPNNYVIEFLKNNEVEKVKIILTHEHRDHVYGIYLFQENFQTEIVATKYCSDYISQKGNSRPVIISFILEEYDKQNNTNLLEAFNKEYIPRTYKADITFESEYSFKWQGHCLDLFTIQGHSKGSCVIILDKKYVFMGDSLLLDYPIITRFPGGSTKIYKNETLPLLEKVLNSEMIVFPGHGNNFKLNQIMKDGKINVAIK